MIKRTLSFALLASAVWCQQNDGRQDNNSDDLQIAVIAGEDGANIVQDGTFAETIVEVRDKNDLPIAGAAVTFGVVWAATHTGGSSAGMFANGDSTMTVTTDVNGRAAMTGFHPQASGPVRVQIQASYNGHYGHLTVHQTNFPTTSAARAAGKTPGTQSSDQSSQASNQSTQARQSLSNTGNQAVGTASTGMSTAAKVGIVTGIAGGAGAGAAYAAGLFKTGPDCTSQANTMSSAIQTMVQQCTNDTTNAALNNCLNAWQTALNDLNSFCSCAGGIGDQNGILTTLQQEGQALGHPVNLSACH